MHKEEKKKFWGKKAMKKSSTFRIGKMSPAVLFGVAVCRTGTTPTLFKFKAVNCDWVWLDMGCCGCCAALCMGCWLKFICGWPTKLLNVNGVNIAAAAAGCNCWFNCWWIAAAAWLWCIACNWWWEYADCWLWFGGGCWTAWACCTAAAAICGWYPPAVAGLNGTAIIFWSGTPQGMYHDPGWCCISV